MYRQLFIRKTLSSVAVLLAITAISSQNYVFAKSPESPAVWNESQTPSEVVRVRSGIDAAFNDTVFIGDSITAQLRNYVYKQRKSDSDYLGSSQFLARSGFSSRTAHSPISETSLHPFYDGEKVYVENAINTYRPLKIYVMLGINDIVNFDVDKVALDLEKLLDKILAKTPRIAVAVQSITPMLETHQKEKLNNAEIAKYNELVKAMCKRKGYTYLDTGAIFRDKNGALRENYCSDPETMGLHINESACEAWVAFLRKNSIAVNSPLRLPSAQPRK